MRDIWKLSMQVAGVSNVLSYRSLRLKADKATLAGLVHLIGVLPILTYAEDNFELLSDPISLNHVIERIHPVIGERLLRSWDFPEELAIVPRQFQNFSRVSDRADYVDLVQVATVHIHEMNGTPYPNMLFQSLPAVAQLGLNMADGRLINEMNEAMTLLY
jgi:HD-like signal output (HDOD) protein